MLCREIDLKLGEQQAIGRGLSKLVLNKSIQEQSRKLLGDMTRKPH